MDKHFEQIKMTKKEKAKIRQDLVVFMNENPIVRNVGAERRIYLRPLPILAVLSLLLLIVSFNSSPQDPAQGPVKFDIEQVIRQVTETTNQVLPTGGQKTETSSVAEPPLPKFPASRQGGSADQSRIEKVGGAVVDTEVVLKLELVEVATSTLANPEEDKEEEKVD